MEEQEDDEVQDDEVQGDEQQVDEVQEEGQVKEEEEDFNPHGLPIYQIQSQEELEAELEVDDEMPVPDAARTDAVMTPPPEEPSQPEEAPVESKQRPKRGPPPVKIGGPKPPQMPPPWRQNQPVETKTTGGLKPQLKPIIPVNLRVPHGNVPKDHAPICPQPKASAPNAQAPNKPKGPATSPRAQPAAPFTSSKGQPKVKGTVVLDPKLEPSRPAAQAGPKRASSVPPPAKAAKAAKAGAPVASLPKPAATNLGTASGQMDMIAMKRENLGAETGAATRSSSLGSKPRSFLAATMKAPGIKSERASSEPDQRMSTLSSVQSMPRKSARLGDASPPASPPPFDGSEDTAAVQVTIKSQKISKHFKDFQPVLHSLYNWGPWG